MYNMLREQLYQWLDIVASPQPVFRMTSAWQVAPTAKATSFRYMFKQLEQWPFK